MGEHIVQIHAETGAVVNYVGERPKPRLRSLPVRLLPRDFARPLGRDRELGEASESLAGGEAERAELNAAFEDLRSQVADGAPPEKRDAAVERVADLETAIVAEEPDTTTMGYVKKWFAKNVPTLAGAVVGLLVNPIVGKIVQSAGDAAVADLQRAVEG